MLPVPEHTAPRRDHSGAGWIFPGGAAARRWPRSAHHSKTNSACSVAFPLHCRPCQTSAPSQVISAWCCQGSCARQGMPQGLEGGDKPPKITLNSTGNCLVTVGETILIDDTKTLPTTPDNPYLGGT